MRLWVPLPTSQQAHQSSRSLRLYPCTPSPWPDPGGSTRSTAGPPRWSYCLPGLERLGAWWHQRRWRERQPKLPTRAYS